MPNTWRRSLQFFEVLNPLSSSKNSIMSGKGLRQKTSDDFITISSKLSLSKFSSNTNFFKNNFKSSCLDF